MSSAPIRVALVPGVLALLPEYAGLDDPVADLRAACLSAVSWLGSDVEVLADAQGAKVAGALLDAAGVSTTLAGARCSTTSLLVVGNGSARRTEKAPGFLDERAAGFDASLRAWLGGDGTALDSTLGSELLASLDGLALMETRLGSGSWGEPVVDYDDDPYGVQYWVMRWELP